VRRRECITLLGGAAVWPLAARAQQPERMRRIGVLIGPSENDPDTKARLAAFRQGLQARGWSEERNIRIEYRFAAGSAERARTLAGELVALQPDVIFAQSPLGAAAVQRETRTTPIVFSSVGDPIGLGLISSLARPGANVTGLTTHEAGVTGKWLAMLKEYSPKLARIAFMGNPRTTTFDYYVRGAEPSAAALAIELVPIRVESPADIELALASLAQQASAGLVVMPDPMNIIHRALIIRLAARHALPAVYDRREFIAEGGLMSYGIDRIDEFRRAAAYVDRILRGDKPADLPVQAPTKFETVLNLRTAKALGVFVPPGLLVAADEVIE
jgi:putative ABC transport system substrate-binding protein